MPVNAVAIIELTSGWDLRRCRTVRIVHPLRSRGQRCCHVVELNGTRTSKIGCRDRCCSPFLKSCHAGSVNFIGRSARQAILW